MKHLSLCFSVVLVLLFGVATMAHAWGLPKRSFNHAIEKALQKERWNKPDEAMEYWQEALEKGEILLKEGDPENTEYLLGTASAYYHLGNYDRAIALYEKMLKVKADMGYTTLAEDYPWIYVYLGLAYAKKGDSAKAVAYWKQVPTTIGSVYTTIQEQLTVMEGQQTAAAK